jgi:hypothetical protein
MKTTFITIAFVLVLGKSFAQHKLSFLVRHNNNKVVYELSIPFNYKLVKGKDDEGNAEKSAHLQDGSVIYITDDLKNGGGFYDYKIEKYGNHYPLNNYILNDTATLYGVHKGKYWRERKYYAIVVGYYDATAEERAMYDRIIDAIIIQVDTARKKTMGTGSKTDKVDAGPHEIGGHL